MEGKVLHYNIIERELAVVKQKYQLTYSRHYSNQNSSEKAGDGKENIPFMDANEYSALGSTFDSSSLNALHSNEAERFSESMQLERDSFDKFSSLKKAFPADSGTKSESSDAKKKKTRGKMVQEKYEKKLQAKNLEVKEDDKDSFGSHSPAVHQGGEEDTPQFGREKVDDIINQVLVSSFNGDFSRKKVKMGT